MMATMKMNVVLFLSLSRLCDSIKANVCTCPGGTPTVASGYRGTLCEANGAVDCSACYAGFTISAIAGTGLQTCQAIATTAAAITTMAPTSVALTTAAPLTTAPACSSVAGASSSVYPCKCGTSSAATVECTSDQLCTASDDSNGVCTAPVCSNVAGCSSSVYPCKCGTSSATTLECTGDQLCTASDDSNGVCTVDPGRCGFGVLTGLCKTATYNDAHNKLVEKCVEGYHSPNLCDGISKELFESRQLKMDTEFTDVPDSDMCRALEHLVQVHFDWMRDRAHESADRTLFLRRSRAKGGVIEAEGLDKTMKRKRGIPAHDAINELWRQASTAR